MVQPALQQRASTKRTDSGKAFSKASGYALSARVTAHAHMISAQEKHSSKGMHPNGNPFGTHLLAICFLSLAQASSRMARGGKKGLPSDEALKFGPRRWVNRSRGW